MEVIVYEGLVGIKVNSPEEAMKCFENDLNLLYNGYLHYFEEELKFIEDSIYEYDFGSKEYKKYKRKIRKLVKDYRKQQEVWLKNKEWKSKFEEILRKIWANILKPENYQGIQGYVLQYSGNVSVSNDSDYLYSSEDLLLLKDSAPDGITGIALSNELSSLLHNLDIFINEIQEILSRMLNCDDETKWMRLLTRIYTSEDFPVGETHFYAIQSMVRNFGIDGWEIAMRRRAKIKKNNWLEEDYDYYIFPQELKLLIKISNKIGHYINIHEQNFYPSYRSGKVRSAERKIEDKCFAIIRSVTDFDDLEFEDFIDIEYKDFDYYWEDDDFMHIRSLGLRGLSLSKIPEEIFNFKFLNYLDLSQNSIEYIPEAILNLKF